MTQDQLDRLLAGQLSPTEYDELSARFGQETLRRVLEGDVKLRDAIVSVSSPPPINDLAQRIGLSIEQERKIPLFIRLMSRWGVLLGGGLALVVAISVVPAMVDVLGGVQITVSPLLMAIGGILVIGLGVAAYLEFGDRR